MRRRVRDWARSDRGILRMMLADRKADVLWYGQGYLCMPDANNRKLRRYARRLKVRVQS